MSEARPVTLEVKGMTCQGCVNAVTRIIRASDPGAEVHVDLATGRVEARTSAEVQSLAAVLTRGGYEARPA